MILGAIFDFDNTLYDYELINKISLNKLFSELSINHNLNITDIENIYKKINKDIKNSNNTNNKFNKIIYIKKILETLKISLTLLDKYYDIYISEFNNNFILYDNVLDLFKTLKKNNIKIGICSNNIFIQQYDKLKKSDLLEYIDCIQTSDECGEEKPHLNIFLDIQNKLEIPFENLVFIGDNYDHDIYPLLKLKILPFHYVEQSELVLKNNYIQFGNFIDLNLFFEKYFETVDQLIFLSKYFGQSVLNIQGPGGNISIKLDDIIFIKSSGAVLGNLSYNEGYCLANNVKCMELLDNNKELELKNSKIFGYKIPSMETFFHSFMKKYTVHIHFTLSNILFCSNKEFSLDNFSYKYEIIKYIPPGLLLAKEIYKKYDKDIDIYFLENHGLIITSNELNNIIEVYENTYKYFNNLVNDKFNYELNTFYINKEYYLRKNRTLVIRNIDYPYQILEKIKYCFPDLGIFIEKIGIFNNLEQLYENMDNFNIIIINNIVYLCAENLNKLYYLIELIDKYKVLSEYSYDSLNKIDDVKYLQNMEQEKFRKL
jgi:putative hydrolase of the HAD superfamily